MKKSLRVELKKVSAAVLLIVFLVLIIFIRLDDRERNIFNQMIERNEIVNELYHTMGSMENNLALYQDTGEKVYYDSYLYFGERLNKYLERLQAASPEKKYVASYITRMKRFNEAQKQELQSYMQEQTEDLTKIYQELTDMIVYTKNWIMKDLEMHTREYQKQMDQITGIRYMIVFFSFLASVIGGIALRRVFARLLDSIKKYQKNAQALSRHQWEIEDVASGSYEELDELGKAMNHMKHEIRRYLDEIAQKNRLEAQLREEKLQNERKDRALVESKLRELNAKVDPHFLFNSLNLVGKYALLEEPEKAMEIVEGISKILRYSLEMTGQFTELEIELDIVNTYIFVQTCRFGDKIAYQQEIDPQIGDFLIPSMTLQPLVENCFKHGMRNRSQIKISLRAFVNEKGTVIEIYDDGNGIENVDELLTKGIGLKSVSERMELLYCQKGLLQIESESGSYTRVRVLIPRKEME